MNAVQLIRKIVNNSTLNRLLPLSWLSSNFRYRQILSKFDITQVDKNIFYVQSKESKFGLHFPFKRLTKSIWTQLLFVSDRNGYLNHYMEKYCYDGFVIPDYWDVIDCGAYVGGFSLAVAQKNNARIFAVEPSPHNFHALTLNLELLNTKKNILPLNFGLGDQFAKRKLHISSTGQDDSLIGVDDKFDDTGSSEIVEIHTLSDLISKNKIDVTQCFLKVEAEGFEPEVIAGLGNFRPAVISIDVSSERFGQSPLKQLIEQLEGMGYGCHEPSREGVEPIAMISYWLPTQKVAQ